MTPALNQESLAVRDLAFFEVAVPSRGVKGKVMSLARRALRRPLLPFFVRLAQILGDICRRLDDADLTFDALRTKADLANSKADLVNGKADRLGEKADLVNGKADRLNHKLDQLNAKLDGVLLNFEALSQRQDELRQDVASVVALNWDHTAIARRLAQLEDRLIGLGAATVLPESENGEPPSIRFPGLEHYDPRMTRRTNSAREASPPESQTHRLSRNSPPP
jgi:hypothetical protein